MIYNFLNIILKLQLPPQNKYIRYYTNYDEHKNMLNDNHSSPPRPLNLNKNSRNF